MARHSSSASQCESVATYMDGVQVEISNSYRIPRIKVPPAYCARLPNVDRFTYDFSLDKAAVQKMNEWRRTRTAYVSERRARLEEKKKKDRAAKSPPSSPKMMGVSTSETSMLLPQPLLSSVNNNSQNFGKVNGLDYSDFDNDTSSPFDNMELKIINEMEELAQVLSSNAQWGNAKLENPLGNLRIEDSNENLNCKCREEKRKAVTSIMDDLNKEIEKAIVESSKPEPQDTSEQTESIKLLSNLSKEDRNLVKDLCDMGFSLSRVVKAIRDFKGQDNKKIVEYLLAIQSLEDLGMTEDEAIKALHLTQYDKHKAKVYYESLCVLRDLGFPEDKASMALLKCNIDRDSALDLLIA